MPRRSSATATADQLEQQVTQDSDLEDLPDFEAPSANGVRHSEQCGVQAPWGARCDLRIRHEPKEVHSWGSGKTHEETLAELDARDDRLNGQAELPGTPPPAEREAEDWEIPSEMQFAGKDFVSAPGLKAIGEALIEVHAELNDLHGLEIRYLWKRRGGTSGGNPKLGALQRPGGLLRYFTGGVTFICWLAADNCRALSMDATKIEACLFHQLSHAELDPDDDDAWRIRGHSFEGFVEELDHYGAWSADLREAAAHLKMLPLDEALAEADADDEAEEGEESE